MGARTEWKTREADFSVNVKPDEKLLFAVKYALLAASEIYWPSWEYHVIGGVAELVARDDTMVGMMDQEGRETLIGCGVSLQLFKLTLKRLGCLGRVELFPDLDRPTLAARIHLGGGSERSAAEGRLFAAIKPDYPPLANRLLASETAMALLESAVAEERAWLQFAKNETSWERLHTLAIEVQQFQVEEVRLRNEASPQLAVKVRPSSAVDGAANQGNVTKLLPGALAVLKTKTDDKHGWLAAGQALARVILQARVSRVSCALHSESLRGAQERTALRSEIGRKGFAQAILRFGIECQLAPPQLRVMCQPALEHHSLVFTTGA